MSHDELLARLAHLDSRDRAWLLGELPPALRRELAEVLAAEDDTPPMPAAPAAAASAAPVMSWENLEPQRAADVLDGEPVWLVSAATRSSEARWRELLLQAMTSRRRHEIELADRNGRPLGARATQLVLAGVRERIESGATRATGAPRSKFAALVDQMKRRFA